MKTGRFSWVAMVGAAIALSASFASAQINSTAQPITLNAKLNETLTLNLSANTVSFNLSAGSATNAGTAGVTATTTWVLAPGRANVNVYAYFASSTAALTDGTNNIPSSAFYIKNGAAAAAALTSTYAGFGGANAALLLGTTPITATNRSSSRTDNLTFNIDLSTGTLPQLPASSYAGTLNIQAQAL